MKTPYLPGVDTSHPLFRSNYGVFTPPIAEMADTLGDWIEEREPGGYIYGPSRFGKTYAVRWHVTDLLRERFEKDIPLVTWSHVPDSHLNEAQFWNGILHSTRFALSTAVAPYAKSKARSIVAEQFMTLAERCRDNHIVLIIDEAQAMREREWIWLMGLQNFLDDQHYRLSVFSVGSHQLKYTHQGFISAQQAHVAARFMVNSKRFRGIAGVDELAYALRGYDIDSEWPAASKESFTRHFAKRDFLAGHRLEDCSVEFWACLRKLTGVDDKVELECPMRNIALTVERLLKRLARGEVWDEVINPKSLLQTIAGTGLSNHMHIIRQ